VHAKVINLIGLCRQQEAFQCTLLLEHHQSSCLYPALPLPYQTIMKGISNRIFYRTKLETFLSGSKHETTGTCVQKALKNPSIALSGLKITLWQVGALSDILLSVGMLDTILSLSDVMSTNTHDYLTSNRISTFKPVSVICHVERWQKLITVMTVALNGPLIKIADAQSV